jgi:hypothetical protein
VFSNFRRHFAGSDGIPWKIGIEILSIKCYEMVVRYYSIPYQIRISMGPDAPHLYSVEDVIDDDDRTDDATGDEDSSSSAKRIAECNEQGLEIAYRMLGQTHSDDVGVVNGESS